MQGNEGPTPWKSDGYESLKTLVLTCYSAKYGGCGAMSSLAKS